MSLFPKKWQHSLSHQESRVETLSLLDALLDFTEHMCLNQDGVSEAQFTLITGLENYETLIQICRATGTDRFYCKARQTAARTLSNILFMDGTCSFLFQHRRYEAETFFVECID
jgi:hypothetical protein